MRSIVDVTLICLLTLISGTNTADNIYGNYENNYNNYGNYENNYNNYGNDYEKRITAEDFEKVLQVLGPLSLMQGYKATSVERKMNETGINSTCGRDIAIVLLAAGRGQTWALKMLDASSKIPSGIMEGNLIDMGMYDECVRSHEKSLPVEIRGRHCMYTIEVNKSDSSVVLSQTLSVCLPATCNAHDLSSLFSIADVKNVKNLSLFITSASCSPVDSVVWDTEFTVCFVILIVFVGFLVICSVCDHLYHCYEIRHPTLQVLSRFSLQRSATSILSTDTAEGNFSVVDGIRVFSTAWIVMGHVYFMIIFVPTINTIITQKWALTWWSMKVFTGQFIVDTFFMLNGFLITHSFLKKMSKQRKFNVLNHYAHRILRLTPPLIALILLTIVFLPKFGSGPRWDTTVNVIFGGCRKKWWTILLYVHNYFEKDNLCLPHLWYLSVEMQLFCISPLILYPLHARPKVGLGILSFFIFISLVIPATIIGVHRYQVMSFPHNVNATETLELFRNIYEKPHTRATPWLLGILLGYELTIKKRTLSKTNQTVGWLSATGAFAFCFFGLRSFLRPDYKYEPVWETFYGTVARPLWAAGVCWIIYASAYDFGGLITKILSWKYFLSLSKLSYNIYLVHFGVYLINIGSLRTSMYFSDYNVWQTYVYKLTESVVIAFIFYILFTSPAMVLQKLISNWCKKYQRESQRDVEIPDDEENLVSES